MILFHDWTIESDGLLARQFDNLSRRLEVIGDLPEGWNWTMLVQVGDALDIIPLSPMDGGAGHTLSEDQLSLSGYYTLQLRGTQGDTVKHTNIIHGFVAESLSGSKKWPSIPSEFLEVERRIAQLNAHPPIPGENGFWMVWNPDAQKYETSRFPLPDTDPAVAPTVVDTTLTIEGAAADAKITGNKLRQVSAEIRALKNGTQGDTTAAKTGNIVTVTPASGTTASVVSNITGQKADWIDAKVLKLRHFKGKNLFDFVSFFGGAGKTSTQGGLTAVINANGTATIIGENTSGDWVNIIDANCTGADNIPLRWIFPAGTYTVPMNMTVTLLRADSVWTKIKNEKGTFTIDEPFWIARAYLAYNAGAVVNETIPLCMVSGTTIPSTGYTFNGEVYTATFSNPVADGEFNWQTGELKDMDGNLVETVGGFSEFPVFDGENTFMTGVGVSAVTYKAPNGSSGTDARPFNPEAWGMPVLYLDGNVSAMSKDNAVSLNYVYGAMEGTCSVKWQGSSSLSYPKKNYTIKFDKAFEAKTGWGEQTKYCLKANYIDFSHSRNIVSALLWGQIVASRTNINGKLSASPNYGAVDGFPVLIVMNGEFVGLYTFNIPKDAWMMDMGNGAQECILCAGNATEANYFKAEATLFGETDLEIEYITNEDDTAWAVASVNNLIRACINSNGADLDTTIASMLDWESAIDYYIFVAMLRGDDMVGKNYLLNTYDGTKWFFGAYDMDSTYGLQWDGKKFLSADDGMTLAAAANQHRLMELIKAYKTDALKARYAQLRRTVLSEDNVNLMFRNFSGQIPRPVLDADNHHWPLIPNTSVNNVQQILDWYRLRCLAADAEIAAM